MHTAQFVLKPTPPDAIRSQLLKVRAVLGHRFAFGTGREERAENGVRTVFNGRANNGEGAAVIEVEQNLRLEAQTLLVKTGTSKTFADIVGAVEQSVSAVRLKELVAAARSNTDSLVRLGLGLVGVRFDRGGYDAIADALMSPKSAERIKAAVVASELGWRSLLRPMWNALVHERPGTPGHADIALAFSVLDSAACGGKRHVLSRDMIIDDVATLSSITIDHQSFGLIECRDGVSWSVHERSGRLAWGVFRNEDVLVFEAAEAWQDVTERLVSTLGVVGRVELLAAAAAMAEGSLLRLASAATGFDPLVDDLLAHGLRSDAAGVRFDALLAIASADWDPALPDLEDMVGDEDDPDALQLAQAILIQQRGF